ncbi:MAG: glycosyltransferase family 4 protein [Lachnospiraceae bacterium]|nr:glycosyltransferase family 4 protein [Lachnospiraceae bacterium]
MKEKILIVHNYYQIPGGEDTVVVNEKKLLEDNGHKVILYSRNNSELKTMSTIQKLLLPFTTVFSLRTYREVKQIIKEQHIGIVHIHNTLNLISPSVYYAAFSCKVPVVQTIHNFRMLCPGATFYRDGHICEDCVEHGLGCAVKHNCYRGSKLQTLMCVITTKIHRMLGTYKKLNYICLTEFNKQKLLQLKQIKPEKVFVKPNFTFRADVKHQNGLFYLYIGRIEAIKGVDKILSAFSKMPDKQLKLAGTGTILDELKDEYQSLENVEFLGYVEHEDLIELVAQTKALIIDSQWYEPFGMIVIEAYASGVPVIAGDIENISSLVTHNITGIKFKYDSIEELIAAVDEFESSRQQWNQNVIKEYEEMYSPERNIVMLETIYQDVAQPRVSVGGNRS